MNKLTSLFLIILFFPFAYAYSQADSLDINNINAGILTHGDMWWNADSLHGHGKCEFPKGSGKYISTGAALWMGGYDHTGQLHMAAQTYRQEGNDYWPGPLDSGGALSTSTSNKWDRVWKITYTQMDSFKATTLHTVTNIPKPILEWPAKGNPYAKGAGGAALNITTDMAPFVDADHDGMYDPTKGDYPAMKGDQMIWWVFSDNGYTHNETNGRPLKVEIHATAYA